MCVCLLVCLRSPISFYDSTIKKIGFTMDLEKVIGNQSYPNVYFFFVGDAVSQIQSRDMLL